MTRDEAIEILRQHLPGLARDFGVKGLALFGSWARGDARPESDVDVLAEFDGAPSFDQYMGLKLRLEDLLIKPVDLVTLRGLKPRLRPIVEREAMRVT